jgi:putative transposase
MTTSLPIEIRDVNDEWTRSRDDNNFRITSQSVNGGNTISFGYDTDSLLTSGEGGKGVGSLFLTPRRVSRSKRRMPRRPRLAAGDLAYHVLNRRVGRIPLFEKAADYVAFERILAEAVERTGIRIAAYCLMPNHWHLLLWPPRDGELSEMLRWITVTHTQRWHAHRHTAGTGPVYQGRFKSFPMQTDEHFLTVARSVERNALRAKVVDRAEAWQWSSLWRRVQGKATLTAWLSAWPVERPPGWVARVNRHETASDLVALRLSVQRGRPFGEETWVQRMTKRFGLESTVRPRGRPKGS